MSRNFTDNKYTELEDCFLLEIKYKNEYIPVYFDKEDLLKVKSKHWRTSHKRNKIYICTGKSGNIEKPLTYLHNYILNYKPQPKIEVDHIDGNSCNNRKTNLRIVPRQVNIDNTKVRIDNKIGIRGVSKNKKTGLYICDFSYHGKRYYFKNWKTAEEAVYNRKIAEDFFRLETLSKNPLAEQYLQKLSENQKQTIANYVYSKIS